MKTKNLFIAAALCLAGNFAIGAVLTVDNNPTNNAQYSTIPAAMAAANDFDTLLVQPSALTYGSFTINKPLVVIGSGYNEAFGRAECSSITIASSNVTVEGFLTTNSIYLNPNASNFNIRNCYFALIQLSAGCNNILISGNVFHKFIAVNNECYNILILNNILNDVSGFVGNCETILFKNNIIRSHESYYFFNVNSSNATFADNIFYATAPAHFNIAQCINCSFQNNLTYSPGGAVAESPNTTLNNVAPTWELNGLTSPFFNFTINYAMLSGAPATGASDGGQVGIYGAGFDFHMNGFPLGIPRVTFTQIANPVVLPGGEIQVTFEAEAGSN